MFHRLFFSCQLGLFFLILPCAYAQEATDGEESNSEPVYELSPFEVNSSEDVGYRAQNTLAGSRLNTNLKDTAAAISVFNAELLEDLAVTNELEAIEYSPNAKVDHDEVTNNVNGNVFNGPELRGITIRGITGAKRTLNFFEMISGMDFYNTERIDFSRGPNSILYGVGPAAGVVNMSTKQAHIGGNQRKLQFRIEGDGSARSNFDVNQTLIEDRLAIRLNYLHGEENTWREVEYKDQDRGHLALRYKLDDKTTIRLEGEYARIESANARPWTGLDNYSTEKTANFGNLRMTVLDGENEPILYDFTGVWRSIGTSVLMTDFDLLPREAVIEGSVLKGGNEDYYTYSGYLNRELWEGVDLELSYNYQNRDISRYLGIGNYLGLYRDLNATSPLVDGPNPYYGRYFLVNRRMRWDREIEAETYRASLSFDRQFKDWFRFRGAFLYEHRGEDQAGQNYNLQYFDGPDATQDELAFVAGSPGHGRNSAVFWYYIPEEDVGTSRMMLPETPEEGPITFDDGSGNLETLYMVYSTTSESQIAYGKREQDSIMAAGTVSFWDDRIHMLGGIRREKLDFYDDETDVYENGVPYFTKLVDDPAEFEGDVWNFGVVADVTPWFSLFYNTSTSFDISVGNQRVLNVDPYAEDQEILPDNREGETEDFGFKLDLFGGKVFATFTRYETVGKDNLLNGGISARAADIENIWKALHDAGLVDSSVGHEDIGANVAYYDHVSEGYEFELTANVAKGWRVMMNYAFKDTARTNQAGRWRAYVDAYKDIWLEGNNEMLSLYQTAGSGTPEYVDASEYDYDPIEDTGFVDTVGEAVIRVEESLFEYFTLFEGVSPRGTTKHSFNLRTNYLFTSGALKGFSIGGGVRLRFDRVMDAFPGEGYGDPSSDEFTEVGNGREAEAITTYYADTEQLYDFNMAYTTYFADRKYRLTMQLNVNNVFDNDDLIITRLTNDLEIYKYRFQTPRQIMLTTTLTF